MGGRAYRGWIMDGRQRSAEATRHAWLRWAGVWHAVFAVAVLLGVVGALRSDPSTTTVVTVAVALGASYAWTNILRPPTSAAGQAAGLLVSWGLWLAAIWLHVAFAPVGAFLAAHVCYLSLRCAIPVATLFVGGIVARDVVVGGGPDATFIGPVVVAAVIGVLLASYVAAIARESAARADLIDQLEATRADLARVERDRGVLEERRRVARDVHDTLAQSFTSVITQLQAAQATDGPAGSAPHVDRALAAARDGLQVARRIVWDLDTEVPALQRGLAILATATATQHVRVDTSIEGTAKDLPEDIRRELLAVTQEALTNVARHADTDRADVHLTYAGDGVTLTVADHGRGFDPAETNGGYGLRSIRERVARIGGAVEIATGPGRGTRVHVEVPGP